MTTEGRRERADLERDGLERARGGIAESDEVRELRERIDAVEREALDALCEMDDIRLQVNPRLLADYAILIGCHENELFAAGVDLRRARRQLALARRYANRGAPVDEGAIARQLDEELAQWREELQGRLRELSERIAQREAMTPLSPEASAELKRTYRELMRRLHPDANPNQTDETRRLFALAQQAFANGDLEGLRAVKAATSLVDAAAPHPPADPAHATARVEDELAAHLALVEATRDGLLERLDALRAAFPYPLRERLYDEGWVNAQVRDLQRRIDECRKAEDACRRQYRELVGGDVETRGKEAPDA